MTKKEAASLLRKELNAAIRGLPDNVNYITVSRHEDEVQDYEETQFVPHGHLYQIELIAEVEDNEQ